MPRVDLLPEPSEEDGRVARGRRRRRRTRLVAAVALGAVVMFFGAAALARMITDSDVVATQGETTASASPTADDTPSAAASPAESPVAVASPSPRVTTPAPTPTPTPTARPTAPVAVLNNSTIQGLAARSAERVRSVGFTVPRVGNVSGQIDRTTVYYRAGYREQADLLAGRLRGTQAIRPAPSWLPGSTALTLVVTSDFE